MPQASRSRVPPQGITPGPPGPAELKFARWAWLTILLWQLATLLAAVGTVAVLRLVQGAVLVGVGVPVILVVVFGVWFAGAATVGRLRQRARHADLASVKANGFKVCVGCRYDLPSLPEEGRCPECGRSYQLKNLARAWAWTYQE